MSFIQRKFTRVKCDGCEVNADFYSLSFNKRYFKSELRAQGWTFGERGDFCPECSKRGREKKGNTKKPTSFIVPSSACG